MTNKSYIKVEEVVEIRIVIAHDGMEEMMKKFRVRIKVQEERLINLIFVNNITTLAEKGTRMLENAMNNLLNE